MSNSSASGGYLNPAPLTPYPGGVSFNQFLQTVFVGLSGLPTELVRPKWQKNPPKQPDVDVNWFTIGLGVNKSDANAFVGTIPHTKAQGWIHISHNPLPFDTLTVNGVTISFVSSNPTSDQVLIGVSPADTAVNIQAFLSSSSHTSLALATYAVYASQVTITAINYGSSGNDFTLATSTAAFLLSGNALSGGAVNSNITQRHEDLEIKCSFYGPDSDEIASLIRDSFQIQQNLETLKLANMGFVGTSEAMRVPDLVNERWVNRYEMSVFLRRERMRTYPILNFVSASGVINTDTKVKTIAWTAEQ